MHTQTLFQSDLQYRTPRQHVLYRPHLGIHARPSVVVVVTGIATLRIGLPELQSSTGKRDLDIPDRNRPVTDRNRSAFQNASTRTMSSTPRVREVVSERSTTLPGPACKGVRPTCIDDPAVPATYKLMMDGMDGKNRAEIWIYIIGTAVQTWLPRMAQLLLKP